MLLEELRKNGVADFNGPDTEIWDFVRQVFREEDELIFPYMRKLYLLKGKVADLLREAAEALLDGGCIFDWQINHIGQIAWDSGFPALEVKVYLERLLDRPLIRCVDGYTYNAIRSRLTRNTYWAEDECLVWVTCEGSEEPCLENEVEEYAFWCNHHQRWFSYRDFECVSVEGETYLLSAVEENIFLWSDGTYHWEPEMSLGLRRYHEGRRRDWEPGQRLSFELEVEVGMPDPIFGDEVRKVWDEAEEDSSLNTWGAELIVGFVPLENIEEKLKAILSVLRRFDCEVPNERYGFHVSASISGWGLTEDQVEKLAPAFYSNENLVCRIGGRRPNRYCCWQHPSNPSLNDKYLALRRSGDRLEFRIFKASVSVRKLRRCALLVEAFLKFALSEETDFMKFLEANYPDLV